MKPQILLTLLAQISFCAFLNAATLTISDATLNGDPFAISINPGDSFDVQVNITTGTSESFAGLTYLLSSAGPMNGVFSITNRVIIGSSFTDTVTTTANIITGGLLDPVNNNDLGAILVDTSIPLVGPGTFYVATISFSSSFATTPGNYSITFPNSAVFLDGSLNDIPFDSLGSYTVTVIPEPTTMALLAGSLTAIMVLRRRRRIS